MRKLFCEFRLQIRHGLSLLLFPTLFFFTPHIIHGQNVTLTTQSEVDAFNHSSITGNLIIKGQTTSSITNLDGLSELTSVGGFVIIEDNSSLTNISGLSNLSTIGNSLDFERDNSLTNIDALSSLTSVGNALLFFNNIALTNLDGLSNLILLGGGINLTGNIALTNVDGLSGLSGAGGFLEIKGNNALTNIAALSDLTAFGDINIESNSALTNINFGLHIASGKFEIHSNNALTSIDLPNLTNVSGIFTIAFNPVLTSFDLSKLATVVGHFSITGNPLLTDVNSLSSLTTVGENFAIASNNLITNLDGLTKLNSIGLNLSIINNAALTDFCGLHNLFAAGSIAGTTDISNNGANTVTFTQSDVTVNTDPGVCSAVVPNASIPDPISGCLPTITKLHTNFPAGNIFPGGTTAITWTATDGAGNTVAGIQNITVVDNQAPVISASPSNITVSCAADVPAANVNLVTATDNCGATVTHVGDEITNQTCANRFTVTRTYQVADDAGNTAKCTQVITVNDNTPPQINSLAPSQTILWPPNHTMRDITLNYTVTDNCTTNATTTINISSNEPVNGTADGDTDPDWMLVDNHHLKLRAERAANGTGRIYTITVTTTDGCNAPVSASTQVEVVHNITGPQSGKPFIVGSTVNFSGEFWDKPTNKHTSKWLLDGNTSIKGTIIEPTTNKNGKATGSYKFTSAGVYKLQMNIIDQNNITSYSNTNGDIEEIIVIYDPNGGYTYGGGWFESPAGAIIADPTATGKASYGFTVNYFKNSTYPKGETQFEFKVGSLEFNALNYDYLVINGARAQFKGTGRITGDQSGYAFIMTVIDGNLDGTGVDKIRMKIFNKNNGRVIYDNLPGVSDTDNPTAAVGDNSSVVVYSTSNLLTKATNETETIPANSKLQAIAFPNPSTGNFSVTVHSDDHNSPINLQIVDINGRIVEERKNINANSLIKIGERYTSGVYIITVSQNKNQKQLKLVKTAGSNY